MGDMNKGEAAGLAQAVRPSFRLSWLEWGEVVVSHALKGMPPGAYSTTLSIDPDSQTATVTVLVDPIELKRAYKIYRAGLTLEAGR